MCGGTAAMVALETQLFWLVLDGLYGVSWLWGLLLYQFRGCTLAEDVAA